MNEKLDERQLLVSYKYGYRAFLIVLIEAMVFIIMSMIDIYEFATGLQILLEPQIMIIILIMPALLYYMVESTLSGALPEKTRLGNMITLPILTIGNIVQPWEGMKPLKYAIVLFCVVGEIVMIYSYKKDKKEQKEENVQ